MVEPRIFVNSSLSAGLSFEPADAQAHYLSRVLRLGDGASVLIFNGRDGEWAARIKLNGRKLFLDVQSQTREQAEVPDLNLAFAPLKKTRTDFIVEKATELGVRSIEPVQTAYTQTGRVRTDRLQATAIEAAEQTERLDVPEIMELIALDKWMSDFPDGRQLFFCDESADRTCLPTDAFAKLPGPATLLIGPEGGFSPDERRRLLGLPFTTPITLGPRILRAETACVAALTLWQSTLGDWTEPPYVPE